MREVVESWEAGGRRCVARRWEPEGKGVGGFFFFHGQGDFCERYREVFAPLVGRGWVVQGVDLPGHGRSEGRRGDVWPVSRLDELERRGWETLRGVVGPGGALGVMGHSMGGHLALRSLARVGGARWQWGWLSSPLVVFPDQGWKKGLLEGLARWVPTLSWGTGVRPQDCLSPGEAGWAQRREGLEGDFLHSRISLRWGLELERQVAAVGEAVRGGQVGVREVLVTQGMADRVCSAEGLRQELAGWPFSPEVWWLEGLRHEPLRSEEGPELVGRVGDWLDGVRSRLAPGAGGL